MASETMLYVSDTFLSIQGESTWAGLPCFFIRLSGCNLRCRYCDTPASSEAGVAHPVNELVEWARKSPAVITEITGGEPLLQEGCCELAERILETTGKPLLIETNGSMDISRIPEGAIAILDMKCPGSGHAAAMDFANLGRLRPCDEVKFVIADRHDFEWAEGIVRRYDLPRRCHAVLFGAVHGELKPSSLGQWIMDARLPVRLHLQLHKIIGVK